MNPAKKSKDGSEDRISDLPGNVTERILELMPIRDAVRTSILSTKWRYNWAKIREIVFDYWFFSNACRNISQDEFQLVNIINEFLLLHDGPIFKFVLCIPKLLSERNRDVDRWLIFLSRNHIKELTLDNSDSNIFPSGSWNAHTLPSCFFSSLDLTHLELCNYLFNPPPAFGGFRLLISLEFHQIVTTTDVFERLISSSFLLERLKFSNCEGIEHYKINAPNLKCLCGVGNRFNVISFTNTLNLLELSLSSFEVVMPFDYKCSNMFDFIGCFPSLKKFHSSYLLGFGDIRRLPIPVTQLTHLDVRANVFGDLESVICLLRRSPKLQELEISNEIPLVSDATMEHPFKLIKAQDIENNTLDHLKIVTLYLHSIKGLKIELELIKYLLDRSPVLESLLIECSDEMNANSRLRFSKKLLRLRRASPRAAIIF